jgi:hypothetical protein
LTMAFTRAVPDGRPEKVTVAEEPVTETSE